jgi:hypothetical protein
MVDNIKGNIRVNNSLNHVSYNKISTRYKPKSHLNIAHTKVFS